jgi:hypothetical protein
MLRKKLLLIILLIVVGFAQNDDNSQTSDSTYTSNIITDSTKIKQIKFLGMKIGWKRGNKWLKEDEMLRILWENPSTHYELTSYRAKRLYSGSMGMLSWMIIWTGLIKGVLLNSGIVDGENFNLSAYQIAGAGIIVNGWLSHHEQKHIIQAVKIYNGEVTYTTQNPFKKIK